MRQKIRFTASRITNHATLTSRVLAKPAHPRQPLSTLTETTTNARVAITFARPEESRHFLRRLAGRGTETCAGLRTHTGRLGAVSVRVAHTGIGTEKARATVETLLSIEPVWMLIAAGFCGGLDPRLAAGDVVIEEYPSDKQRIHTRSTPAETVEEKAHLSRETGAQVVDMETAAIAAVCAGKNVPLLAIRAVSDTAAEPLPVPFAEWFNLPRQHPRPLALLAFLALHPSRIAPFTNFLRRLPRISAALALSVEAAVRAVENH